MDKPADKNFDDLAPKFTRKVYGGLKGDIRLAVLKKDLGQFCKSAVQPAGRLQNQAPLNILDAGSGYGPFSLELARMGHQVVLCDISQKMLDIAQITCDKNKLNDHTELMQCSIQKLPDKHLEKYDLVLCHAVLEWVQNPEAIIQRLLKFIKPNGFLSLTFYNLNGMILKNLLRANYQKIVNEAYSGWPGSLTPSNPLMPEQVLSWLDHKDLTLLCHSGMRVFHDYILDPDDKNKNPETVLDLELSLSRKMPFRDLGRYQHIIVQKNQSMD